MRYLIISFCVFLLAVEIAFPVGAVVTPPIDDVEAMLRRIEGNLRQASVVVSFAKTNSAALVAQKQVEKAELKEAVVTAESKVEALEAVQEVYVAKMVAAGMDTASVLIYDASPTFQGAIYDAFLKYQKEGGTEDFEYFRLYIYK